MWCVWEETPPHNVGQGWTQRNQEQRSRNNWGCHLICCPTHGKHKHSIAKHSSPANSNSTGRRKKGEEESTLSDGWWKSAQRYPGEEGQGIRITCLGKRLWQWHPSDNWECKTSVKDKVEKTYIALFTCAVIRAVHLELVSDMSTEMFLLAFKRFISRRGLCKVVYSDNARTSFKWADHYLRELWKSIEEPELLWYFTEKGITWKYIAERAAWWSGFWERLVR